MSHPLRCVLSHRRDHEGFLVRRLGETVGPALRDDFVLGPEPQAFLAILADVAEARALPAAEAVIRDGHGDRHVYSDHSDVDPGRELARGVAVASEDRDAV